ncbi:ankyrin repeat domain-containing protein [Wolbachia endosymbiont (group B) of Endotricha flammealis]|uniref:ankyrin repeat domain-containing protein n=1 Tax=Wolbachia endosymbiont (group B) of Endotricha flammealis TaxID=2954005 RepID=UPI003877A5F3
MLRDELTLLHIAAEYSNEKVVQALLGAGASVNAVDSCGRTPLRSCYCFQLFRGSTSSIRCRC